MMKRTLSTALIGIGLSATMLAQQPDRFLPVRLLVESAGKSTSGFVVTVYNGNEQVMQLPPSPFDACELLLDINTHNSIRVSKPGMRDKLLTIDTHLPEGVERYKAYPCIVVMEPASTKEDGFFTDFPNAVVRWNPEARRFDHSDHYLSDIRARTGTDERTAKY